MKLHVCIVLACLLISSCSKENDLESISDFFKENENKFEEAVLFINSKYVPLFLEKNYSRLVIHPSESDIKSRANIYYDSYLDSKFKNSKLQTIKVQKKYCDSTEEIEIIFKFSSEISWKHDYFIIHRLCEKYSDFSNESNSFSYTKIDDYWTIEEDRNAFF